VRALFASAILIAISLPGVAHADNPPRKSLSGWIPYYWTKTALPSALANSDLISEVTPFWYTLKDPQTIQDNYTAANPSVPIAGTIASLQQAGYLILPTITDGTAVDPKSGKYVQLALSNYLANPTTESQIVSTILNLVTTNKYDGIDLDWENFAYVDPNTTWGTTQNRWVTFIKDLSTALHAQGKILSITTPPLFDPASGKKGYYLYAWSQVGSFIDRLRIMAYDYSTSSPGPIGPITWTESAVQYAISVMPASKVFVGIPGYGRDWVTKVDGTCPSLPINYLKTVSTSAAAATFVMHDALNLATTYAATPTYVAKYGESTFTYQKVYNGTTADGSLTTCTATRTVWYQDAQGFSLRAALVAKYHLGGIAEWTFGMEDPTAVAAVRLVATSIAPDPVVANLSAGAAAANLGAAITLTGGLRKKDTTPFSGIPAQVEMKTSSTDWTKIYGVNTAADGTLSIPLVVAENVQLRIRADGTWDRLAALSTPVSVNVSRLISINLPTSMKHGVAYVITGQLQPKEAGITVHLDHGSTASPADAVTAVTDTSGHFTFTLTAGKAGTYSWRASVDADTRFIASQSDFVTVVVR
jgi:spore germination protein YaaH